MFSTHWDFGTAYDFFVSLYVLHRPADFGLRPSWAAGVRSRLPAPQRDIIEKAQGFLLGVPLPYLYQLHLPEKNAQAVLDHLAGLPPVEFLQALSFHPDMPAETCQALLQTAAEGACPPERMELIHAHYTRRGQALRRDALADLCQAWSQPDAFAEACLAALKTYQQVFFAEEEARITPVLQDGLQKARQMADRMKVPELLAELSRGVRFESLPAVPQLVLAPSYWSTPLVIYRKVSSQALVMLFGCRPNDQTLVPGETVPDALVAALRALDDPTRLRILRYLAEEPLTPSALSRRLRLRPPTVVHHLNTLRLAGLVEVTVQAEGERRYALRSGALTGALADLQRFIFQGVDRHA